jgi:UDP:flavonoid glycosyltransferase YjiC (YdhE family)
MHIIYYVTSHGYGHAVRTVAIANVFSKNVNITFRTALPEAFFREEMRRDFSYAPAAFDCGCVQTDSLNVDIKKTLSTYRAIAGKNSSLLESEARWCASQKADVIVSDIVPFAFDVAEKCAVPSVAVANFTWYDIYKDYVQEFTEYKNDLEHIRRQYERASLLLSLEPALPMGYFKKRMAVPPTGRRGRNCRAEILRKYGLPPDRRLGLVYFGFFGISGLDIIKLAGFSKWEFLGICPLDGAPGNYHLIPKSDFPYQDLAASADLMVCKLGYGAVAEAMMHGTPLLYPPRGHFAEFPALDRAVRSWGGGYPLSREAFAALDWRPALAAVIERGRLKLRTSDGAGLCAAAIEKLYPGESWRKPV